MCATRSSSDHRGVINLRANFPEQLSFHDLLGQLRNDALAHYGPGEFEPGREFHREHLILPIDRADDMRIAMLSRRMTFDPPFVRRLHTHLLRAIILTQRVLQEREAAVVAAIDPLASEPSFARVISQHRREVAEVVGDRNTAQRLLAGRRQGLRTEMLWDGWARSYPPSE